MSNDLLKYLSEKVREEMKVIESDTVLGHAKDFTSVCSSKNI